MTSDGQPKPQEAPWYAWPLGIIAAPLVLVLGMILLPLIGLACIVCSPWYFLTRPGQKREEADWPDDDVIRE